MASKNINIALFLTINLFFFGFTMAQDPGPQAPTCPRSTGFQTCVSRIIGNFDGIGDRTCCLALKIGLNDSEASACICDAVKLSVAELADSYFEPTGIFRTITDICFINRPAGFICA